MENHKLAMKQVFHGFAEQNTALLSLTSLTLSEIAAMNEPHMKYWSEGRRISLRLFISA